MGLENLSTKNFSTMEIVYKRLKNERQWKKSESHRYDHILLEIVPPNTKPFYELYWRLMGGSVKPDPMVFKKRTLKPEFRNIIGDLK